MPSPSSIELSVTWDQVAAFRLARHYLLEPAPAGAIAAVAGEMGGVQAQLISAAQLSLAARVRDLQLADLDGALNRRVLVKAAAMRQTQFWLPADELAVFVRGSARRADKAVRWMLGKGVSTRDIDAAIEATLGALNQPHTRPEIAEIASRAMGVGVATVNGGVGWGSRKAVAAVSIGTINLPVVYVLQLAATRGVCCSGPNHGNEPTFVRADGWIPGWRDMARAQAEATLLVKYLRAFGPATAADFSMWSGMTLTEARALWRQAGQDLMAVDVKGWTAEILRADGEALSSARIPSPHVRLLPYFDTYLLGHRVREHLAAREHQPRIYRPQGWIAQVALIDGRVAGLWESKRVGNTLRVHVTRLGELPPDALPGLESEASRIGQFLGAESVDVQVV